MVSDFGLAFLATLLHLTTIVLTELQAKQKFFQKAVLNHRTRGERNRLQVCGWWFVVSVLFVKAFLCLVLLGSVRNIFIEEAEYYYKVSVEFMLGTAEASHALYVRNIIQQNEQANLNHKQQTYLCL